MSDLNWKDDLLLRELEHCRIPQDAPAVGTDYRSVADYYQTQLKWSQDERKQLERLLASTRRAFVRATWTAAFCAATALLGWFLWWMK